jgi:hypothetical protein
MTPPQPLKYDEWEQNGRWHCADVHNLTNDKSYWWYPARCMGMPLVDFVKMLINEFQVDYITFPSQKILIYSWKSQAKMRKFKNWINAQARKYKM